MKATDLMIGDWVDVYHELPDESGFYKPLQVTGTHQNDGICFGHSVIECPWLDPEEFEEFEEAIKPIPLTSEILEKNGFKEDSETNGIYWRPDCRKFCIVKELDTWYFAFRVLGETVDKSSGYICISKCNYVHKLQHKLKDLKIEKEIIL